MNLAYPDDLPQQSKSPLWPLNAFYASNGRKIPDITSLTAEDIPQPYHKLLVHERNMTSTLEAFHAGPVYIDPLNMVQDELETSREVILRRQSDDHAVEYGASWVFHRHLPEEASKLIREAKLPLGTVLKLCACPHSVETLRYFKMRPAAFFSDIFGVSVSSDLFGRRHRLVAPDGHAIAAVFEILPPLGKEEFGKD